MFERSLTGEKNIVAENLDQPLTGSIEAEDARDTDHRGTMASPETTTLDVPCVIDFGHQDGVGSGS